MKLSIALSLLTGAAAFQNRAAVSQGPLTVLAMTPEEERAEAMASYFAKAHEEKLRAIAEVEAKKNAEIAELKAELESLQGAKASETASDDTEVSPLVREEMVQKLTAYQDFMAEYIVKSHEQKYQAVKEAEEALNKKWEEKMQGMSHASAGTNAPPVTSTPSGEALAPLSENRKRYLARVQAVKAAAEAGNTRWHPKEVEKSIAAAGGAGGPPVASKKAPQTTASPQVAAADHGLRSAGAVTGPSLAERVSEGANVANIGNQILSARKQAPANSSSLYEQRNAKVIAEAKAGKSRWGSQEVDRIQESQAQVSVTNPEATATFTLSSTPLSTTLYALRNAKVMAEAAAGKSRWGKEEISKIQSMTVSTPSVPQKANGQRVVSAPVPPEVIAADHGLRADGGVSGLTLAERVSMGAHSGTQAAAEPSPSTFSRYEQRNVKVLAEAAAGKSRWGKEEIERINGMSVNTPIASAQERVMNSPQSPQAHLLYNLRNAKVLLEADAGKSRWGEEEIEKIRSHTGNVVTAAPVPAEVIAADHGLRSDGGVGGPSLADRIAKGANIGAQIAAATQSAQKPTISKGQSHYQLRNAKVLAEAAAGKSRWGQQEIAKVKALTGSTPATTAVPPEVLAADHGLRADGGVGGLTLAERIAMGANAGVRAVAAGASATETAAPSKASLYQKRNENVLASAAAGKSRWGSQEIAKIESVEVVTPDKESLYELRNVKVLAAAAAGKSRWGSQEIQKVGSMAMTHVDGPAHADSNVSKQGRVNTGVSIISK